MSEKRNVTNQQMLALADEYRNINQGLLSILLASRLKEFHRNNQARMETAIRDHQKIIETHCEFENGQPKVSQPSKLSLAGQPPAQPSLVFKEGYDEKSFNAAMEEFMKKITVLEI